LAAIAIHPSLGVVLGYLGTYVGLRVAMTSMIGMWGLRQRGLWKKMFLIVVWDTTAFLIWLASFLRRTIRWRQVKYYIRDGMLVPATSTSNPADE
jgi:ceramide glucosyltransferase